MKPILEMKGITKEFPGVKALDNVNLTVMPGEIHVLVGENGAGKSTLIKMASGYYHPDEGEILLEGEKIQIETPFAARNYGISTVYQELALSPYISVAENIYMGRLPRKTSGVIDWKKLYEDSDALLKDLNIDLINSRQEVGELKVAYRQLVEIARAFSINTKILILDEPTSVLTDEEAAILFENIRRLKKRGVGIIYISHRIGEVLALADRISVMRDGKLVGTVKPEETDYDTIVKMMVGHEVLHTKFRASVPRGAYPMLQVKNACNEKVKDISFEAYSGEILGFYGLVGSGRTELMRMVFGLDGMDSGEVFFEGNRVSIQSPVDAIALGMGFVSEDRRNQGLALMLSVRENISLANHEALNKRGLLDFKKEAAMVRQSIEELKIKTPDAEQEIQYLSGGNQQKAIIARWIRREPAPKLLILDEPTRGVDVGAKTELHQLLRKLADEGMTVLVVSSDMPEILAVSDRIIVLREGKLSAEFGADATEEQLIFAATN